MTADDLLQIAPIFNEIEQCLRRTPEDTGGVYPIEMDEMRLLCAFFRHLANNTPYHRLRIAIETGSFTGSSALALRLAPATVISIDDHQHPLIKERGPGFWITDEWKRQTILWVNGQAMPALHALDDVLANQATFFFSDGDHIEGSVYEELDFSIKTLGAIGIACHDIERGKPIGTDRAFRRVTEAHGWPRLEVGNIGFAWNPKLEPPGGRLQ